MRFPPLACRPVELHGQIPRRVIPCTMMRPIVIADLTTWEKLQLAGRRRHAVRLSSKTLQHELQTVWAVCAKPLDSRRRAQHGRLLHGTKAAARQEALARRLSSQVASRKHCASRETNKLYISLAMSCIHYNYFHCSCFNNALCGPQYGSTHSALYGPCRFKTYFLRWAIRLSYKYS